MVDGKDGDGTAQGTCLAGTLCHADGKCKGTILDLIATYFARNNKYF